MRCARRSCSCWCWRRRRWSPCFGVGLASGVLQAVTQVRERSLSTVPRIVAALVALALAGPWIATRLEAFLRAVLEAVPALAAPA